MIRKNQRNNNISLKLTDNEKERVTLFANQRDLSVAEYVRMSALKHKIKPTVVEIKRDTEDQNREESEHLKKFQEIMNRLSPKVAANGYVNYKEGGEEILELIKLAESLKHQQF